MKRASSIIANLRGTGLLLLILALLIPTPANARSYSLAWQSDWPIAPETIAAVVVGGELIGSIVADDGKSGQIDAVADQACLTIRWSAQTVAGFPVAITRSWLDECPKLYMPVMLWQL